VLHTSIWGDWNFVWGAKPTKAPHGDGIAHTQGSRTQYCRQDKFG